MAGSRLASVCSVWSWWRCYVPHACYMLTFPCSVTCLLLSLIFQSHRGSACCFCWQFMYIFSRMKSGCLILFGVFLVSVEMFIMIFSFILLLYSVDRVPCLGAYCLLAWALPGCDRCFLVAHTLCSWDKHSFGVPYWVEGGGLCWLWIHTAETLRWFCWVNSASSSSALFFLHSSFEYHAWPLCCRTVSCQGHWVQGWLSRSFIFIFSFFVCFSLTLLGGGDLPHSSQINAYRGLFFLVNT